MEWIIPVALTVLAMLIGGLVYIIRQEGKLKVSELSLEHIAEQLDHHVKNCPHVSEDRMKALEDKVSTYHNDITESLGKIENLLISQLGKNGD